MGVLSHAALEGLASDPRSGVVAVHKSVQLVMENNDFGDIKESIVKKLNSNTNKYYPDAGGIMMGYQGVKLLRSSSEVTNSTTLHPVYTRAKFYLFCPQVGAELQCEVSRKEEGLVTCMAHGVFEVQLVNPPQCWQAVYTGQTITVKVDAVEQLAWQEPRIVVSLLEVGGDIIPPFIDIVDNFEADEVECVTDSGMFEYEQSHASNNAVSREQVTQSSNISDGSPHPHPTSRKRKMSDNSSAAPDGTSSSPAKKRSKRTKKASSCVTSNPIAVAGRSRLNSKSSVDSETSPTSHSSSSELNIDTHSTSARGEESDQSNSTKPMAPPLATSPGKVKPSAGKKSVSKSLSKILPKPSKCADSGHDSSTGEDENPAENGGSNDKDDPTKIIAAANEVTDTSFNLCSMEALNEADSQAPVTPVKSTKVTQAPKAPKTPTANDRKSPPPGFIDDTTFKPGTKSRRVRLTAPSGQTFNSYKTAWAFVDQNPDYLVKEEPRPGSVGGRESPDNPNSQLDATVEITPVDNAGEEAAIEVPENPKPVNQKEVEKSAPSPVAASKQGLLVDQPSFTESETEFPQSQNLLAPKATPKKANLKSKPPKVSQNTPEKAKEAQDNIPSDSETPKTVETAPSPSTNIDASRTSSNESSDSEDSSDEENTTQVVIPTSTTQPSPATVAPPEDDSSSYDDESSDDDTVTVAKAPTRPSETVRAKSAESSDTSSDSDSDSSSENHEARDKPKHGLASAQSVPVQSVNMKPGKVDNNVNETPKQNKPQNNTPEKHSSSSSNSESEKESPQTHPKQKKRIKKKNSPKTVPNNSNASDENKVNKSTKKDKSPHLSSTVVKGVDKFKEKMSVPDGISPILKARHKPKAPSKTSNKDTSYYDELMANSKIGSQKSEVKQAGSESGPSDKKIDTSNSCDKNAKKKKKNPAGFL